MQWKITTGSDRATANAQTLTGTEGRPVFVDVVHPGVGPDARVRIIDVTTQRTVADLSCGFTDQGPKRAEFSPVASGSRSYNLIVEPVGATFGDPGISINVNSTSPEIEVPYTVDPATNTTQFGGAVRANGTYHPEMYNPTNDTDWSAAFNAMFAAMQLAKGGVVILQPNKTYRCDSVITLPTYGVNGLFKTQYPVKIIGSGGGTCAAEGHLASSVLDLRGIGAHARLVTIGVGHLEVTGVQFADLSASAANSTPFVKTTATVLDFHEVAFVGSTAVGGDTCNTDAIVLGGTTAYYTGDANAAFSGYGSCIRNCFFDRIRIGIVSNVWAESNVYQGNMFTSLCGGPCAMLVTSSSLSHPSATDQPHNAGNLILGNRFTTTHYVHVIKVVGNSSVICVGNTYWDNQLAVCLSPYRLERGTIDGTERTNDPSLTAYDGHSEVSTLITYGASVVYKAGTVFNKFSVGDRSHRGGFEVNDGPFAVNGDSYFRQKLYYKNTAGTTRLTVDCNHKNPIQLADGTMLGMSQGTTAQRPSLDGWEKAFYYDKTINKPIYTDGAVWRDFAGNVV